MQPVTVQNTTPYTVATEYQKLSINPTSVNMDYAPINNPTFTGTVTLPEVDNLSNDNTAATTSFCKTVVGSKLATLINNAPAALDTLNELAAALNNDASFGSAVTTSLAKRYTKTETDNLLSTKLNTTANIPMTQVTDLQTTLINIVNDLEDPIPISQVTNLQSS